MRLSVAGVFNEPRRYKRLQGHHGKCISLNPKIPKWKNMFSYLHLLLCCLPSWEQVITEKRCWVYLYYVSINAGSDDCPSTKIQPLGCYNEGSIGLFTRTLAMNSNNSVLNCTGRCREAGFTFAAMLNGTGCSCGNLQPLASHRRPLTECGINCPGDKSEKCGGPANRITCYYVEPFGIFCLIFIDDFIKHFYQAATGSTFLRALTTLGTIMPPMLSKMHVRMQHWVGKRPFGWADKGPQGWMLIL